jgi:hypothetical protein
MSSLPRTFAWVCTLTLDGYIDSHVLLRTVKAFDKEAT